MQTSLGCQPADEGLGDDDGDHPGVLQGVVWRPQQPKHTGSAHLNGPHSHACD
jgi:hypothetical protein